MALAEGTSFEFQFGNVKGEGAENDTGEATDSAPSTGGSGGTGNESMSAFGRLLSTAAKVAGVLVLMLAGGVAVLFVLSQRRRY